MCGENTISARLLQNTIIWLRKLAIVYLSRERVKRTSTISTCPEATWG